jgi:alpha-1,2-mannosyltransferase
MPRVEHPVMDAVHGDPQTTPPPSSHDASRRWWWRLLLTALVILVGVLTVVMPGRRGWFDIAVYYDTVKAWAHSPGHLYDFVRPGTPYGFTYPPFAAMLMLPMAWLGWHAAIAVNLVITIASSAFLVFVLIDGIARREGWNRRRTYVIACCLLLLFEPVRDTISYGQINLELVALVYADLALMNSRWSRFAGIGTGLATAIKLTPGLFIVYFLLTGRWRAAAISGGTAIAATAVAAIVAPTASVTYFTKAMWDTSRVGTFSNTSNQSLMGLVARLHPGRPDHALWLLLVVLVLGVWVSRIRAAKVRGNDRAGFAVTGLTACLISPITWVHHLVWLLPALVVLADLALRVRPSDPRRWWRLGGAAGAYLVLCSGVLWIWPHGDTSTVSFFGSNLYVLISLLLLVFLPFGPIAATPDGTAPPPENAEAQAGADLYARANGSR